MRYRLNKCNEINLIWKQSLVTRKSILRLILFVHALRKNDVACIKHCTAMKAEVITGRQRKTISGCDLYQKDVQTMKYQIK